MELNAQTPTKKTYGWDGLGTWGDTHSKQGYSQSINKNEAAVDHRDHTRRGGSHTSGQQPQKMPLAASDTSMQAAALFQTGAAFLSR
jgi:hypothetical protein